MKPFHYLFSVLLVSSHCIYAQSGQKIDCKDKKSIPSNNQKIRDKVYQHVGYIKGARAKLFGADSTKSDSIRTAFHTEYDDLQQKYDHLFGKMKDDIQKLKSKKKVCEDYGIELDSLVSDSHKYIAKVQKTLNIRTAAFGIDDLLALFGFIEGLIDKKADNFYKDLKWEDWDAIKKREL